MAQIRDTDELLYRNGVTIHHNPNEPRWMTREEAVALVLAWKDMVTPKYNLDFSSRSLNHITSGVENAYLTTLAEELIERIRNGTEDPITEVAMYYYDMDAILAESDDNHFITHRFASYMENAAHDVLNYLQKKEKEIWENECKKLLRWDCVRA